MSVTVQNTTKSMEVERISENTIACLRCKGRINETFEGKKLASSIKARTLVLDVSGVERISSFGIREWKAFISAASRQVENIYLVGCPPRFINQLNMVRDFVGKGRIITLFAPYRCSACGTNRNVLTIVDRDREAIRKRTPLQENCPDCGTPLEFDEEPNMFFSHIAEQPEFELEPELATFLVSKIDVPVSAVSQPLDIEKHVDGQFTYLKLGGVVDKSFPTAALAEGLEGTIALDVTGIGALTPSGAAEFRRMLSLLSTSVELVLLEGCQPGLLEQVLQPEDLGKNIQLTSLFLPYRCTSCPTNALERLDVQQHHTVLKVALLPEMKCKSCGQPTRCVANSDLLGRLGHLPLPAMTPALKKFIAREKKRKKPKKRIEKKEASGGSSSNLRLVAAAGAAIVTVSLLLAYTQQRQNENVLQKAIATIQTATQKRPQWISSDTPSTGYCTDLANKTVCVGVSSFASTKEDGRTEAWNTAVEALVNTVGLKIDDPIFAKMIRRTYAEARQNALLQTQVDESSARIVQEARQRVTSALSRSGVSAGPSDVADWFWEEYAAKGPDKSAEFLVFVRVDVSSDEVKTLERHYSTPSATSGAKALSVFPSLTWRFPEVTQGALLTSVDQGALKEFGLAEGDIVTAVRGVAVKDAVDFGSKLSDELSTLDRHDGHVNMSVKKMDGATIEFDRAVKR